MNYIQAALHRFAVEEPDLDPELVRLYTLLVLTKGEGTTLEDVHDAWALWRNTTNPWHKSLIPFDELAVEVQELDRKYVESIHETAVALETPDAR